MVKHGIPLAAMERVFREADEEIRVAESAKEALKQLLEEEAIEMSGKAAKFAEHAGRRTVKEEDITLAAEHLK